MTAWDDEDNECKLQNVYCMYFNHSAEGLLLESNR